MYIIKDTKKINNKTEDCSVLQKTLSNQNTINSRERRKERTKKEMEREKAKESKETERKTFLGTFNQNILC